MTQTAHHPDARRRQRRIIPIALTTKSGQPARLQPVQPGVFSLSSDERVWCPECTCDVTHLTRACELGSYVVSFGCPSLNAVRSNHNPICWPGPDRQNRTPATPRGRGERSRRGARPAGPTRRRPGGDRPGRAAQPIYLSEICTVCVHTGANSTGRTQTCSHKGFGLNYAHI